MHIGGRELQPADGLTRFVRPRESPALGEELRQLLKAQFSARMQKATQQLQDHTQLRKLRRDIARVHTVMAEKAAKQ